MGDHPRGCGENHQSVKAANSLQGSPPRMRGKQPRYEASCRFYGITPADAGKTSICTVRQADTEDHPRGCGENSSGQATYVGCAGSPPRMRGKLRICRKCLFGNGITPADAGKTYAAAVAVRNKRDHPRGCGENMHGNCLYTRKIGSPPRMRGKRKERMSFQSSVRITPADAGKTKTD